MKLSLYLIVLLTNLVYANTNLFYIDTDKAQNLALKVIEKKAPEIFKKDLKLESVEHEFEVHNKMNSLQSLVVTYKYSESEADGRVDNLFISVALDKHG